MMKLKSGMKTRRRGMMALVCSSIALLSVFGVGFSSWIVVTSMDMYGVGIQAAAMSLPYIFTTPSISTFKIGPDGVVDDGVITDVGDVVVTFKVNNGDAESCGYIDEEGNFNMRASLLCTNATFLAKGSLVNPSGITPDEGTETTVLSHTLSFGLDSSIEASGFTPVTLTYRFTGSLKDFYNSIPKITFKAEAIFNEASE